MTSPFPTCPICKHPHSRGSAHIWDDEPEVFAPQKAVETGSLIKESKKLARSLAGSKLSAHNGLIEGSNPSGPTSNAAIAQKVERESSKLEVAGSIPAGRSSTPEICRDTPSRLVAGSASDPVTVGMINRDDETTARQGEVPHMSAQSSQPPQLTFPDSVRKVYQRLYMRSLPQAKAQGLTVKQFWNATGFNWKEHVHE